MSANPQDKNDVTEETFVAQEALYFRTAALSRGVLYYHALSFLLVPVLAQMLNAQIQQGVIFTVIIVFILVLHLAHLVAYFFARPLYSRWTYDIAVEAILISALCIYSGGYESGFKVLYVLLIQYSVAQLSRASTYLTGAFALLALAIVYGVSNAPEMPGLARDVMIFGVFMIAMTIASAEISHFIHFTHEKAVANVVHQVRASQQIAEQRNEIFLQGKKYRNLLETVSAIPWEYTRSTGLFAYIGPQIAHLLGYPLQDWVAKEEFLFGIVHETERDAVYRLFYDKSFDADGSRELEFRVITNTGEWKWLLCSVSGTSIDEQDQPVQGVMFDISARKQGEIDLGRYRERLEEMVEERTRALNDYATKLEKLTVEDSLTGLPNRRYFERELDKEWRRAQRRSEGIAVLMIDVDRFKAYNDYYGHLAGDTCLHKVAQALKGSLRRAGDFVARYGGEEFVIVIPGADQSAATVVAEKICMAVSDLGIDHRGGVISHVTISVGASVVVPSKIMTQDSLVRTADQALYEAKTTGRNRSVVVAMQNIPLDNVS